MIDSESKTPVILIINKNEFYDDLVTSFNQLIGRNCTMILLTNCASSLECDKADIVCEFPDEGELSSFYAVFICQYLALNCAILKGYNVDKPRNLSKEITTK